jgi:ankyrin repeat protein
MVKLLLEKDVNSSSKDNTGRTPLSYAAKNGHEMVVMTLLSNNCVDPDTEDCYGATPLSIAVRNCRTEIVKLLLGTGCVDFNSRDCFGRTPLWWARKTESADIAQLLLNYAVMKDISMYESDPPTEVNLAKSGTKYSQNVTVAVT